MAVIGDVGGHLAELRQELDRLGADPDTGRLPDDLVVVQVGDLVHRGPDSEGVVALVDAFLTRQPEQWIQIVGNHEAQYLREPAFTWPETISEEAQATLRRWWETGAMRAAATLCTADGWFLVTHAGVTAGFWRAVLNTPVTASPAAAAVNALAGRRDEALFRAGVMLGGRRPTALAGPLWAEASTELLPSWLDTRLPFSQIHGHSCLYDWDGDEFRPSRRICEVTTVDAERRHEITTFHGGQIIGVDPCHGTESRTPWRAWESVLV